MSKAQMVTLPDGRQVKAKNGPYGFFRPNVTTLTILEGFSYKFKSFGLQNEEYIGRRGIMAFPENMDVSKHHADCIIQNGYVFLKDAGTKYGTFVKIGSAENKRIELHKGMTFSVGAFHMKVASIEGEAADNVEIRKAVEEMRAAKAAANPDKSKKSGDDDESDEEEFADDSDDEQNPAAKFKGNLDGPPNMLLLPMNKKDNIKGRVRETCTIGADKEKNKIVVKEDLAKKKKVQGVHTRIVLEDGHFYLEDAGSSFGTYVGLPKKKYFEINAGDTLLFGACRVAVGKSMNPISPVLGIVDVMSPKPKITVYPVTLTGKAPIGHRLDIATGSSKVHKHKHKKDGDGDD